MLDRLVTAPTVEPLTLSEVKAQVRVTVADDDALLTSLIPVARERVEDVTSRQLLEATWDRFLDTWPCDGVIELPHPPLQSVEYIKYYDSAGTLQTWTSSEYVVSAPSGPRAGRGTIRLAYNASFPTIQPRPDAIQIRYVAGYGDDAADVPAPLRQAMKLLIGDWYENREDEVIDRQITYVQRIVNSARALMRPYYSRPRQV